MLLISSTLRSNCLRQRSSFKIAELPSKVTQIGRLLHSCKVDEPTFQIIPFEFDRGEAGRRFLQIDNDRFFAPREGLADKGIVLSDSGSVLKPVLVPFWAVQAHVEKIDYKGQYGVTRTYYTYSQKHGIQSHTRTSWYDTNGTVGEKIYTPEDIMIYAGLKYRKSDVEDAIKRIQLCRRIKTFDPSTILNNVKVDPFLINANRATQIAKNRIWRLDQPRIEKNISKRTSQSNVSVTSGKTSFRSLHLKEVFVSMYVLDYAHQPPRIMPGFGEKIKVTGTNPISVPKATAVGFAVSTITAVAAGILAELALPVVVGSAVLGTLISGIWATTRSSRKILSQKYEVQRRANKNAQYSHTPDDEKRKVFSESFENNPPKKDTVTGFIYVDRKWFDALDLEPKENPSESEIKAAFNKKIKTCHPDLMNGSHKETIYTMEAQAILLEALENGPIKPTSN